jgi:type I restriction enzyme, S subunit
LSFQKLPFLDVFNDASGGNIKTPSAEFLEEGEIPVVDQGQGLIAGFVNDRSLVCNAKPPVIVFGDHTRAIKYVDFEFAMGADGTKVLVPKVESDTKYLYHALNSIEIPAAGYSRHYKFLKETQIPLPPLAEQKRIAGILDAADTLRAKRRDSLAQLDTLLQSTFLDMFGDPVTNPMGWEAMPFDKIGDFVSGATPSKAREDYWDGPTPWVSPKDMKVSRIRDAQDHVSDSAFQESNLKRLQPGHLLIVVRGMILAHTFPVATNLVPVAINQDMKGISVCDKFDVLFALECVRHLKRQLLSEVSTAGHGTKRFDVEAMKRVQVPVPPFDLQHRFTAIVESVEQQKANQRAHYDELDALFDSLQSRAFQGEL